MLQRRGLADADYRGERFRDHPREVAGDPDLLNLTRPDVVLDVHRAYLDAGADITTTNTFTATSIGQADYGLQDAVYDLNVEGARLARRGLRRARRRAALRRRLAGAAQPDALALAEGGRPRLPGGHVRPGARELRRAGSRPRRRRRRPAPDRDDLRHAEREGGDRRRARRARRAGPRPAALDLGHDRRPLRPNALRPDARGLLGLGRARAAADRRRQLLARRARDAPARRGARPRCADCYTSSPPQRRPAQRASAATTRGPTRRARCSASSPRAGSSTSSAAAAGRRPSTRGRSRPP